MAKQNADKSAGERWYIRSMGSTCYDKAGVTSPHPFALDLPALLTANDCTVGAWEDQFGWSNQPAVLTFHAAKSDADKVSALLYDKGLIVISHWGKSPMKPTYK